LGLLEGHAQQGPRDKDIEVLFIPSVHTPAAAFCSKGVIIKNWILLWQVEQPGFLLDS